MKTDVVRQFRDIDTSDFPDFYSYTRILDKGLWVLCVAKDKLGIRKLTATEVALIIRDSKEVSIYPFAIAQSFKRAGQKIHTHHEAGVTLYEIMKPGKDHLRIVAGEATVGESATAKAGAGKAEVKVFYFEPGQKYSSKRLLTGNILPDLDGELRIVDPYCSERTLDCLKDIKGRPVKFLTKVENLQQKARDRFLRELQDFKSENPNMEFRNYPNTDLHDRYIISPDLVAILGHSIKDLGAKESFAVVLNKDTSKNIVEALIETFDRRWKQSSTL